MNTIWKIISITSFGLMIYQIFFQENIVPDRDLPYEYDYQGEVFYIAEEMPRFPGCDFFGMKKREKQECSNQKMSEFIYSNLGFQPIIKHFESTAVVQFIVQKDGRLTDLKILKGLSPGLGRDLENVIEKMPRWIPGKQNGQPVAVRFTLPVKICLE